MKPQIYTDKHKIRMDEKSRFITTKKTSEFIREHLWFQILIN